VDFVAYEVVKPFFVEGEAAGYQAHFKANFFGVFYDVEDVFPD